MTIWIGDGLDLPAVDGVVHPVCPGCLHQEHPYRRCRATPCPASGVQACACNTTEPAPLLRQD